VRALRRVLAGACEIKQGIKNKHGRRSGTISDGRGSSLSHTVRSERSPCCCENRQAYLHFFDPKISMAFWGVLAFLFFFSPKIERALLYKFRWDFCISGSGRSITSAGRWVMAWDDSRHRGDDAILRGGRQEAANDHGMTVDKMAPWNPSRVYLLVCCLQLLLGRDRR
jgi:hypothetical protein